MVLVIFFRSPQKWFHKYKLKRMPKYKLNQLQHIVLCSFFSAGQNFLIFVFALRKFIFIQFVFSMKRRNILLNAIWFQSSDKQSKVPFVYKFN